MMYDNDSESEFVNNASFDDEYNRDFDPDPDYHFNHNGELHTSDEENDVINFDPFDVPYWNIYEFNKWNPNQLRKKSDIDNVISIDLENVFIINKPKLKKALNTLTNLSTIIFTGLNDNQGNTIPDEQLFNLIYLDKLKNLTYVSINGKRYSSDGRPNTKSFGRLREIIDRTREKGLAPEGTANLLYNLRTKESGTALPYDLIPPTMSFIHYGKHVPQTISQKRDNISESIRQKHDNSSSYSSSSLGGRKSRRSRKSRKTRKSRKSRKTRK